MLHIFGQMLLNPLQEDSSYVLFILNRFNDKFNVRFKSQIYLKYLCYNNTSSSDGVANVVDTLGDGGANIILNLAYLHWKCLQT